MGQPKSSPDQLRSHRWFGVIDMRSFSHRARTLQMGFRREEFVGRPVIGIINTWSDLNPCHAHMRDRAEDVKRGVWQAGGYPVELPALSLGEVMVKPTTMLYRNLLAIEVEELIRSHPLDAVVLMGGCDKTGPALMMGAISAGLPCLFVPAGALLRGNFQGRFIGSGVDTWRYWDEFRAGRISQDEWHGVEQGMARSVGHCNTMGTATTMMGLIETLGFMLPGASSILAADSNHQRMCSAAGIRAVEMAWADLSPQDVLSPASFQNALVAFAAMAGSTNAVVHLLAMAGRAGIPLSLEDFDRVGREVPVIANLRPNGAYLMEDFFYAGGILAMLDLLRDRLDLSARTISGTTLAEHLAGAARWNADVIRDLDRPVVDQPGLAVLRGNLAPNGAVIKPAAATPELMRHTGRALVFQHMREMLEAVKREDLECYPDDVLVLQSAGPVGAPGMPEWGMLPIPTKLLKAGVKDMVRVSDARMSGTSYGTCVLHVAPESAVGGPLGLVRTGDRITLDVDARLIQLEVSDAELAARRAAWTPPPAPYARGYGAMFAQHIGQADEGCDFDYLKGTAPVPEPEIL
ncbi:MAG: dihydroxy-acid dehydratase [Alphaproteobacteria bacterium]|nr:L-arabinonate dehydratase [Alphaproteobacteria bacterium]TAD86713.1 MAG: dihydroxy-acid dehydratase [Alphaproteobacteria bacterium]